MFLTIPVGDENRTTRTPWVNHALIVINVAVFIWMLAFCRDPKALIDQYGFLPAHPTAVGWLSSMFLHGGFEHIIGNMLFLWIFGDNVEEKFGHVGYLLFYLVGGIFADFIHAHVISEPMKLIPTIGASGAISAVMGAYVFMFPKSRVRFWGFIWLFVFFFRTFSFRLSTWFAVGGWFLLQLLSNDPTGTDSVAYGAHIGGFIFGAALTGLLLIAGLIQTNWLYSGADPRRVGEAPGTARHDVMVPSVTLGGYVRSLGSCPACARPLQPVQDEGVHLDRCLVCGGIWLEPGVTERLLGRSPLPSHLARPPARTVDAVTIDVGRRECPRCDGLLDMIAVEGVAMEACPRCRGLWADRFKLGELENALRGPGPKV